MSRGGESLLPWGGEYNYPRHIWSKCEIFFPKYFIFKPIREFGKVLNISEVLNYLECFK